MNYYFSENSLPCHCMVLDVRPPLYKTTGVGFGKIVDLSVRDNFSLHNCSTTTQWKICGRDGMHS